MTSTPSRDQSANLFKNYNRLIGAAYTLLIIALTLFFGYLLNRNLNEEIDRILGHVERHGQFFEFVLRSSADQLETLRMSAAASEHMDRPSSVATLLARPPGAWLIEDAANEHFNLDRLVERDAAGNLVGVGGLRERTPEFYTDLNTALRINSNWSSLIFTLPNAAEARLVSIHEFQAVLPWRPSSELTFDREIYASPIWTMGQPANNPDREKYWAPVHFGGPEHGLLAPVAASLYDGSRFSGVLWIDTSLDYLNRLNSDFDYPLGLTLLLDQRREVLAHPRLYANPLEVEATPPLSLALPPELLDDIDTILQWPSDRPGGVAGHLVIRHALLTAPWSLLYVVPMSDLWLELASDMGAHMVGVLLGLALLMAITYVLTSREFVGPAAKLVEHIAAESNFEPTTIPVVPSGWRPWFEAITRAFHESMQLVALRQELDIAARMQQSILPRHWPKHTAYTLWGTMRSAREVGGDFYDHFELTEACRGLVVADVSGKGISAGLFGMVSKTLLRSAATTGAPASGEMLARVNDALAEDNENCMFVTLFYARLDPISGLLEYVNAGHPPPLLIHDDGQVEELPPPQGPALGVIEDIGYTAASLQLRPGDTLFMFTDGVTEGMNAGYEEFGVARLTALFVDRPPADPREAVERVLAAVSAFADGFEQSDDITCVALRYHGGETADANATMHSGEITP